MLSCQKSQRQTVANALRAKIMLFWPLCSESEAILSKMFQPGHPAEVFIWEKFHPGYRDLGRKNRDLDNVTGPARPLIRTH